MMSGGIPQMHQGMMPPQMMAMQRPMMQGMPGMPPQTVAMPPGAPQQMLQPGAPRTPIQIRPVSWILVLKKKRKNQL